MMAELVRPEDTAKVCILIKAVWHMLADEDEKGNTYLDRIAMRATEEYWKGQFRRDREYMESLTRNKVIYYGDWRGLNVLAAIYSAGYINGARAQKEKWRAKYGEK